MQLHVTFYEVIKIMILHYMVNDIYVSVCSIIFIRLSLKHIMKNSFFVVSILLVLNLLNHTNACSVFVKGYTIHFKSDIQNENVDLRCQSKDDDIGHHVLNSSNPEMQWSFCSSYTGSTIFFCHFWRPSYDQHFDVFNDTMISRCDQGKAEHNLCDWDIKGDGFYFFEPHNAVWVKSFNWNRKTSRKLISDYTFSP